MPLWLQGAVELALVALSSYLTVGLMLIAVWYTNGFDTDTVTDALSVAGHVWLLVHSVPLNMDIPAQGAFKAVSGTMSLLPLGLTFIPVALCYRSGRRLARASYEGQFWQPLLGGLVAYSIVSVGISLVSTDDYFTTSPVLAALFPLWITALGIVAGGYAESRSLAAMIGVDAADWVKKFSQYSRWAGSYIWAIVRASVVGALSYLAGGALLLVVSLFWHWDKVVSLYQALHAGAVGGFALTLLQLGLLLNLVIYSMAWSSGAGFALGAGTSVDLTGTDVGVMPSLPVLGALPHAIEPWGYCALAVPLIAGAVGGWWFFREGENHFDEWLSCKIRFRWISWPISTLGLAVFAFTPSFVLLFLLGWVANGSLGIGRFTDVGPSPLMFGLYGAVLLVTGMMLGLGTAHMMVHDTSLELERFAEPKPTAAQKKQAKAHDRAAAGAKKKKKEQGAPRTQRQGKKTPASEGSFDVDASFPVAESAPPKISRAGQKDTSTAALKSVEKKPTATSQTASRSGGKATEPDRASTGASQKSAPVVKRPKSLNRRRSKQLHEASQDD